jgi:hypothetical protein
MPIPHTGFPAVQHRLSTACGQSYNSLYTLIDAGFRMLSTDDRFLSFYKLYKKALNTFLLYFYVYSTARSRGMPLTPSEIHI